jgi:Na+-transporting methylmalonyl-CoA/oxaloacetate decarboxylase gamma subunit
MGVFIYLFILAYFDYFKSVQVNKYVDWDVKTITAGDYTVEFDIQPKVFDVFLANFYDPANPINEI